MDTNRTSGTRLPRQAVVMLLLLLLASVPARATTVLVDLGGTAMGSVPTRGADREGRYWNNLTDPEAGTLTDAVDTANRPTTIDLRVTEAFGGVGAGGTSASAAYPGTATKDYFYVAGSRGAAGTGEILVEGLDPAGTYAFTFYGSRVGVNDSRKTHFTIGAKTVTLQAAGNVNDAVRIEGVTPDREGRVTIRVSADPGETAGHLGVLRIDDGATPARPDAASPEADHASAASPTGPYEDFGYAWENNDLGLQRIVPEPWTPIRYEDGTLACWGREYVLAGGVLPRQITSQGEALFAEAPRLELRVNGAGVFGGASGEQPGPRFVERADDRVVYTLSRSAGGVEVQARTLLEYDGFLRVDLTVTPRSGSASIDALTLTLPFRKPVATFFSRYMMYDYVKQFIDRADFADSFGRLETSRAIPFSPAIWIGNHDVGLEWACETDANWSPAHAPDAVRFEPAGDAVRLVLRVVSEPVRIDEPYTLSFALYPTPVKPLPDDWRRDRLHHSWNIGRVLNAEDQRLHGITWWRRFPTAYPGLPSLAPSEADPKTLPLQNHDFPNDSTAVQIRKAVERMTELGIGVIPYGTMTALPAKLPGGAEKDYGEYWYAAGPSAGDPTPQLAALQGIPQGRASLIFTCPYPKSYRDFLVWQYVQAIEQDGIAGAYFDLAAPAMLCHNPHHPHGPQVAAGFRYHPWFATRKFMKRLYVAAKSRDKDFFITVHHAKTPIILSGFADLVLSGEGLNAYFREPGWTSAKARKDLSLYDPDYSRLPNELFEIQYSQRKGFINMLLPQIIHNNAALMEANPQVLADYTRILLARLAVYDIPIYPDLLDKAMYDELLRAQARFGWLHDAEYLGPWESAPLLAQPAGDLSVALYLKAEQDKCMLVVANLTDRPVRQTVRVDLGALRRAGVDLPDAPAVRDAMADQPLAGGDSMELDLPANDFRVFILE